MKTTQYSLLELSDLFHAKQIDMLSNESVEITLDDKSDVSCIELLTHDDCNYFVIANNATGLNESFWTTDDSHFITITTVEETTVEETTVDNLDINAIAVTNEEIIQDLQNKIIADGINAVMDLCSEFSGIELLELCQKLQTMAVRKIKTEIKTENKKTKVNKPETQTEKKERVSAKNFKYYDLLKSWHGVPTDKIIADKLNGGYSSSVINEDKRVINVLMGTDPKLEISQDWANYIIGYWEQNPDTTWVRLHYCFAKTSKSNGARDCQDIGLLCNYIVDNGVSKEDIEAAIASQIASQN